MNMRLFCAGVFFQNIGVEAHDGDRNEAGFYCPAGENCEPARNERVGHAGVLGVVFHEDFVSRELRAGNVNCDNTARLTVVGGVENERKASSLVVLFCRKVALDVLRVNEDFSGHVGGWLT